MNLYKAYCPKCKYTVYSDVMKYKKLVFACTCGCKWSLATEFAQDMK